MGDEGRFSVPAGPAAFQRLQEAGVIHKLESELGDYDWKVNSKAIQ